jgi:hypothetical protein
VNAPEASPPSSADPLPVSFAPASGVSDHYKIVNVAAWANSQEMKTAYPSIAAALDSNPSDRATLVMTGDHWEIAK